MSLESSCRLWGCQGTGLVARLDSKSEKFCFSRWFSPIGEMNPHATKTTSLATRLSIFSRVNELHEMKLWARLGRS